LHPQALSWTAAFRVAYPSRITMLPTPRLRFAFVCCLAACLPLELFAQSAEVQLAFKNGVSALQSGRNADAEREFRNVVKLDASLPEAHLDLGLVLGREGKMTEAITSVRKALQLDPQLESAHLFLGIFEYQAGQTDAAVTDLNQELTRNPQSGEALSWLGIIELAAGKPELAVGPLDRASAQSPNDLNLLEYRGRAHSQVAQETYARMAQIDPDAWQVHKVRAELLVADNKDHDAVTEYEAAISKQPRNPDLYEGLGDAHRRLDELEMAKAAYAKELELAPQNPIAIYNLGSVDIDRGDYADGVALLRSVSDRFAGSAKALYYLGRGLAETGQDAEAAAMLEKSAASDDANGEVAKRSDYQLARVYRKLHKPEDERRVLAAYNKLREREQQQKDQKLSDWRKINGPVASAP
jgi:Flp pilus assembly protein TadD